MSLMKVCSAGHEQVCYEVDVCPVCKAMSPQATIDRFDKLLDAQIAREGERFKNKWGVYPRSMQ